MATTLQAVIGLSDKLTSDLTTRRGRVAAVSQYRRPRLQVQFF